MTDPLTALAWSCVGCAAVPAAAFAWNLRSYRPPRPVTVGLPERVSVLIPARNEERAIGPCLDSVLGSRGVEFEVIVLDDRSEDGTAAAVRAIAARDGRVRLETAPPLPAGWCGKQHSCWTLSLRARHDRLLFLDADVRLAPEALARLTSAADVGRIDLLSGFPHQETGTWGERLVIPLIHFVLLGFLPLAQSRKRTGAAWAAGCGQLFLTTRTAYDQAGGHAAIRRSLHDGVMLPRAYRRAGRRTDVVDLTDLARCRMYRSATEVWQGLAKNATEGLAAPGLIVPASALLLLGQVLPLPLAAAAWGAGRPETAGIALGAAALSYLPRWLATWRFRQSLLGAVLHPVGVLLFLAIQWTAFAGRLVGRPATWKGRAYAASSPVSAVGAVPHPPSGPASGNAPWRVPSPRRP